MTTRLHEDWDIVSSVGLTALAVAGARAIESRRPDALIDDPFAEALVTAADPAMPTPTRLPHPGFEEDAEFSRLWSQIATHLGIRTRLFDGFFADAWQAGVRQAVILASGLDARAWRLDWPAGTTVFEIDQPKVLDFKDDVFAKEGAQPRCDRRAVAVDLRDDWPAALRAARFDPSRPTAWLAEGLLPYLPEDAETRLLAAVHELSAPGSRIAIEHIRASQSLLDGADERAAQLGKRFGIDMKDLLFDTAERSDPDEQLTDLGWQPTVHAGDELATEYGRRLDDDGQSLITHQRFVTAQLPS